MSRSFLTKIQPSGKTLPQEVREFAVGLPDDLGPMFGRDVVRICDALPALLDIAEAAKTLEEADTNEKGPIRQWLEDLYAALARLDDAAGQP